MTEIQSGILEILKSRGGCDSWSNVLNALPIETNSLQAWEDVQQMETEGLLSVTNRYTTILGMSSRVSFPVLVLRESNNADTHQWPN